MKKTIKNNGFTLVELLVSMFIIGMVVAAFVPIFTISVANIYNAGNKTAEVFISQEELEKSFADNSSSVTNSTLAITFPNTSNDAIEVTIPGTNISTNSINMFIPKK